jgi:hypothetical protein
VGAARASFTPTSTTKHAAIFDVVLVDFADAIVADPDSCAADIVSMTELVNRMAKTNSIWRQLRRRYRRVCGEARRRASF